MTPTGIGAEPDGSATVRITIPGTGAPRSGTMGATMADIMAGTATRGIPIHTGIAVTVIAGPARTAVHRDGRARTERRGVMASLVRLSDPETTGRCAQRLQGRGRAMSTTGYRQGRATELRARISETTTLPVPVSGQHTTGRGTTPRRVIVPSRHPPIPAQGKEHPPRPRATLVHANAVLLRPRVIPAPASGVTRHRQVRHLVGGIPAAADRRAETPALRAGQATLVPAEAGHANPSLRSGRR